QFHHPGDIGPPLALFHRDHGLPQLRPGRMRVLGGPDELAPRQPGGRPSSQGPLAPSNPSATPEVLSRRLGHDRGGSGSPVAPHPPRSWTSRLAARTNSGAGWTG